MSGWDFDNNTSTTSESSNKKDFMKLPAGNNFIRVLDAEPHQRWSHWMPQFSRSVTCPGNCPIDKIRKREKEAGIQSKYSMQRKFSMNVYNHGTERIEILDEGIQFMEDLRDVRMDLAEQGKNLTDVVLKIRKRTGEKTTYRIDVDREEPLNDAELKALESRTDFKEYFKPATVDQIQALLEVTENHKEKFVEIMTGESQDKSEETIEVE